MIIDTFHANYLIPKANADPFALKKRMDHIASHLLLQEMDSLLARIPLDASTLVFIKKLSIDLVLNPAETGDRAAARLWAKQLIAAASKVIKTLPVTFSATGAAGKESGSNVALFQDQASFLAHFIHDLMARSKPPGEVLNKWYYLQFRDFSSFSPSHIVTLVCKEHCHLIEAIFALLEQMGRTEKILGSIAETDALFLYSLLPDEPFETGVKKQTGFDEQVRRFIHHMIQKGRINPAFIYSHTRSYRLCLKIYLLFLTLQKKYPALKPGKPLKEAIQNVILESPGAIPLLRDTGTGTSAGKEKGQTTKTAYGGLFLLVSVLLEMHLADRVQASSLPDKDNIPAVSALLFYTASAMVRHNQNLVSHPYIDTADPGFFIFAGMAAAGSTQYLEDYLNRITPAMCEAFLSRLKTAYAHDLPGPDKPVNGQIISFHTAALFISRLLLQRFARRLKGFETSSRAYLFEHFLHRPSDICRDRKCIRITLSPKPLDMVLRMSGILEETGPVPWLKNRNLKFSIAR